MALKIKNGFKRVHNPLEQFVIKPLIPIKIYGVDISFTNSSLFMVLAVLILILLQSLSIRKRTLVPSRLQAFYEFHYDFVASIIHENVGNEGMKYFPFVFSLFMFIMMANLLGMLPYSFTLTSHIIVNFALGLLVFVIVTFIGIMHHGWHFFRLFFPEGIPWAIAPILIPIEVISYLIRPVTLAVRLFANMLAGHVLLKILAFFTMSLGLLGVFPLIFNVLFTGFEVLIALLQAYVFTILTCIYLNDALHLH